MSSAPACSCHLFKNAISFKSDMIKDFVSRYGIKKGLLLDIGCARCHYLKALAGSFSSEVGIELDAAFLTENARSFNVVNASGENIPLANGTADLILFMETIEHVVNPVTALQQIHSALSKDGFLFLTAPNRFYPFEIHDIHLGRTTIWNKFGLPFLSLLPNRLRKRFENARIFTQKDLVNLLKICKFKTISIEYMPVQFENIGSSSFGSSLRKVFSHSPRVLGTSIIILARK